MRTGIDILENELIEKYPQVLDSLLLDHTTHKNIFWASDDYEQLGEAYSYHSQILPDLITGDYGSIIMPRVHKHRLLQASRSKEMAEVFTPSWVCNTQINLIDNSWFKREGVFNTEILLVDGTRTWKVNTERVVFPNSKAWRDYVEDIRLEVACGEAPYITSRYDSTTGEFIPIGRRIGMLDRKLRVISENVDTESHWLEAVQIAYKSIYAFEWQGDSLLIARESLLATFIENFMRKFDKEPPIRQIERIAEIISWNVWQMDGLKGVIPDSCRNIVKVSEDLFGNRSEEIEECKGCKTGNLLAHNGIYSMIMNWERNWEWKEARGSKIRFVDLLDK